MSFPQVTVICPSASCPASKVTFIALHAACMCWEGVALIDCEPYEVGLRSCSTVSYVHSVWLHHIVENSLFYFSSNHQTVIERVAGVYEVIQEQTRGKNTVLN